MKKLSISLLLIVLMILNGCNSQSPSVEYDNFNNDKIITYKHLKHGDASDLAGIILFEYEMDNYTKYQISYLSCTCRASSANYQHLLYLEINNNNNSAEEATIRNIEFQYWGDSEVNPENGLTYEMIEKEFLPYLQYKSKAEVDSLVTLKDLTDVGNVDRNGQQYDFVDAYSGATVSVDNTLAILHAMFDYHADKYY